jgi:hypothetical protein
MCVFGVVRVMSVSSLMPKSVAGDLSTKSPYVAAALETATDARVSRRP